MSRIHVGEFNDSFPPIIDGVAQTVKTTPPSYRKSTAT